MAASSDRGQYSTIELLVVVLVTSSTYRYVSSDVTGTNPTIGSCLCLTSSSINVRDSACGNVIGLADLDKCYRYTGVKRECNLIGQEYEFFEVNFGDRLAWIAGPFMRSEANSRGQCGPAVDELRVIVLGDWGQLLLNGQNRVAAAMANWSDTNEPAWVVSTGDNFYPNGIRAWDDPGVNLKWRNVYHIHESLVNLTWMIYVGNHDYGLFEGEEWNQVELTSHESRWYLPHLWYDVIERVGDHSVHFVIVDTEALGNMINNYTEMVEWFDRTLEQSTADWKIVVGHRHVFSAGVYGPVMYDLLDNLVPIMEKHSVDAYLCGHEHNLQHMRNSSGLGMDYIVSGAGGAGLFRYDQNNADFILKNHQVETLYFKMIYGFVTMTTTRSELVFQYYNERNEYLYSFGRYRRDIIRRLQSDMLENI